MGFHSFPHTTLTSIVKSAHLLFYLIGVGPAGYSIRMGAGACWARAISELTEDRTVRCLAGIGLCTLISVSALHDLPKPP